MVTLEGGGVVFKDVEGLTEGGGVWGLPAVDDVAAPAVAGAF